MMRRIGFLMLLMGVSLLGMSRELRNVYVVPSSNNDNPYLEKTELSEEDFSGDNETDIIEETGENKVLENVWGASEWNVVTLQGKFKMAGLPLSPSVRIFMQKDSLIDLSLRAPLVGEAGRLILTPDSIIILNKINKIYIKESIKDIPAVANGLLGVSEVQNLLLGRFFLPGIHMEEISLEDVVDVYEYEGNFNIIPKGDAEIEGIKYGFTVDETFRPLMLMVLPENKPDTEIDANYIWKKEGYDIEMVYRDGRREFGATFELKQPEWKGEKPAPIDLGRKYRQVSPGEFLRGLG